GLPEVDRGALGAATHLSRLVPQHKMRAMVYTSATATAQELHHFGSVLEVVPPAELRDAAFRVAAAIAEKSPTGTATPSSPSATRTPPHERPHNERPHNERPHSERRTMSLDKLLTEDDV